jgi:hypothetical protein
MHGGGIPMVRPGVKNRVHILPDVGGSATSGAALPDSVAVELSCWPAFIRERSA